MNHWNEMTELDCQLQRLVDGELSDVQSQQLLGQLDDQPDGWRRCAIAFLESQVWSRQLSRLPAPAAETGSRKSAAARVWAGAGATLAIAAGLLAAFLLGSFVSRPSQPRTEPRIAEQPITEPRIASSMSTDRQPEAAAPVTLVDHQLGPSLGEVTLQVFDQSSKQDVTVPVYASTPAYRSRFLDQPQFSRRLRDRVRAAGRKLQREMMLMPVQLGDGHIMIVPIEQIQLLPSDPNIVP